jgi:hypothetical protein
MGPTHSELKQHVYAAAGAQVQDRLALVELGHSGGVAAALPVAATVGQLTTATETVRPSALPLQDIAALTLACDLRDLRLAQRSAAYSPLLLRVAAGQDAGSFAAVRQLSGHSGT